MGRFFNLKKVMLIGSPGSGKSTLSKKLALITGLPLFHLDALYWKPNWAETPKEEWIELQRRVVMEPAWIIDGNYGGTVEIRMKEADTIILLQKPRLFCLWRVLKRQLSYYGKVRPDMGEGCIEHFGWEFVKFLLFIWRFPKRSGRNLEKKLQKHAGQAPGKRIIVLRSDAEAESFLDEIKAGAVR
jgi:adenylate kinase family enzyme